MSENVMEPVETEKVTGLPVGEQEREELPLICSIEQKKEFCDPVVYSCAVCANRVNLECSKMFLPGLFEGKPKILICWPKTAKLPHGFTENLTDVILISDPEKYADRVRWERFGEYPSSFVIYNIRHKDISLELCGAVADTGSIDIRIKTFQGHKFSNEELKEIKTVF